MGYGVRAHHNYTKRGNYTITLVVRDDDGETSEKVENVNIIIPAGAVLGGFPIWAIILLLGIIGVIIAILLAKRRKYSIDDVYLISDAGILIHHATRRLKPDMDEDVLSGMFIAVQDFIRDSFKGEGDVGLKRMDFGNSRIFIERGNKLYLAVVTSGNPPKHLEEKTKEILNLVEKKYAEILENWNGDVKLFRGVGEILKRIWT